MLLYMANFIAPSATEFKKSKSWGLITSIDIHECDPLLIKNPKAIKRFVKELCKKIKVKRYKETILALFGDDPRIHGYSMVQLIESSLISAHFAEESNSIYLDIFSCKFYDSQKAVKFAVQFFKGKNFNAYCILRGASNALPENFIHSIKGRNIFLSKKIKT